MKGYFHSNCVIEALKRKFSRWSEIRLIPIWNGWHFHMMWHDRADGRIWHFTDRELGEGKKSAILFKGRVLNVDKDALARWAESKGVKISECISL